MNSVSPDELVFKYVVEGKAMGVIAKEMGIAVGTVYNYLKVNGVQSRKLSDYPFTDKQRAAWRINGLSKKGSVMSQESKLKMSANSKKGGVGYKKTRTDGYVLIYFPDHPRATAEGCIMEHILVMEALLGRHLNEGECVHHINKIRDDNRKENLKLMTRSEHAAFHMNERYAEKRRKI